MKPRQRTRVRYDRTGRVWYLWVTIGGEVYIDDVDPQRLDSGSPSARLVGP